MIKYLVAAIACLLFFVPYAQARNTKHMYSIQAALNTPAAKQKLNKGIRLYFGSEGHPAIKVHHGELHTNKKSNAFARSDLAACQWAFLSAMLQLQHTAAQRGANAVINIQSNYKKHRVSSRTEFECHAGGLMAGTAFVGEAVKLSR